LPYGARARIESATSEARGDRAALTRTGDRRERTEHRGRRDDAVVEEHEGRTPLSTTVQPSAGASFASAS